MVCQLAHYFLVAHYMFLVIQRSVVFFVQRFSYHEFSCSQFFAPPLIFSYCGGLRQGCTSRVGFIPWFAKREK